MFTNGIGYLFPCDCYAPQWVPPFEKCLLCARDRKTVLNRARSMQVSDSYLLECHEYILELPVGISVAKPESNSKSGLKS